MDAKERPYEMAKVVEMNRGLYALYPASSKVPSSLRILVTLYLTPVLSKDPRDDILDEAVNHDMIANEE